MDIIIFCVNILLFVIPCDCVLNIAHLRGYIQSYHNFLRSREGAADMKYMTWDVGLEARAAHWADRCVFEHQMRGFGENLAFLSSSGPPIGNVFTIRDAMTNWYNEKRIWDGGNGFCGAACHYTQLVWSRTSRLGCAMNLCPILSDGQGRTWPNAKYFVCFYSPQGNWIGEYAFIPGPPCSRCPPANTCFRGLCVGPDLPSARRRKRATVDSHWICKRSNIACNTPQIKQNCPATCR